MEEQKKVITAGIIFILLIAAAAIVYYFFIYSKPQEKPAESTEIVQEQPAVEEKIGPEEEKIEPLDVSLDESDALVRELVKELSSHPELAVWMMNDELIRKFVAAVDNIANGNSPATQIDFFDPKGEFKVHEELGEYSIDPESYERYDIVAEVFASLDTKGCVTLYKKLMPAIQEAYKDLGYPDKDFNDTLKKAMMELLEVPVVDEPIKLEKKVVTYMMAEPDLEALSAAQKHLLRMGPDNVRGIQGQLRRMARSMGFLD
jgi:hypothetical protein